MPELDRGIIIQQLNQTALDIKRVSTRTQGAELNNATSLGRAFLRVGRTYLDESLRGLQDGSAAALDINHYLEQMKDPKQAEQFAVGLSFGILGCIALSVDDHNQYLTLYNNYITGTPIASEPTLSYKEAEANYSRTHPLNPIQEQKRLDESVRQDPSLRGILAGFNNLPYPVRVHLLSFGDVVRRNLEFGVPIYLDAFDTLPKDASTPPISPSIIMKTKDEAWLEDFAAKLNDL